jgi:hypothetical protein
MVRADRQRIVASEGLDQERGSSERGGEEVRSAMESAQVVAAGVSQCEIAGRSVINHRTVARLATADEPPRYRGR